MPVAPGTRIGFYEIKAAIGAGGMGEVYRARDTKLDRDVAIKLLPELFAADPERLSRFEREAKTLAALNHPNIAHIYGTEHTGSTLALVMELVDGEDLAERISRGAIPVDETLDIARQIADALEAAHEHGIVHRDLKPGNVKLRADGVVKVLDFGLAKAIAPEPVGADQMLSPTFTSPATQLGLVLGTAAYMAPEQAKGKAVDRRADIWAFGVVLHEMLTGRNLWIGETGAETMAHVITKEPDLSTLPSATPPRLRDLIARCLLKDPRARLRDIGEARVALAEMQAGNFGARVTEPAGRPRVPKLAWGFVAVATAAAIVFAVLWRQSSSQLERRPPIRAAFEPPPDKAFGTSLALSPDGTRLVFDAVGRDDRKSMLWLQDLATGAATPLKNTENGTRPFWSPDGTALGFFADGKLKRVDLQGGPSQVLADAVSARGGAWSSDGRIVFAPLFRGGLHVMSARGGSTTPITKTEGAETSHRWPVVLPDGQHVIFLAQTSEGGAPSDSSSIDVVRIDGTGRRKLIAANSSALYVDPGFLMFWRDGTLLAQRIDPRTVDLSEDHVVVAENVMYDQNEAVTATVAASGTLVFRDGGRVGRTTPMWVDRTGRPLKAIGASGNYECGLALSPDATRMVIGRTPEGANGCNLWAVDLERGVETALTFAERNEFAPVFSADGKSIYFGGDTAQDAVYKLDLSGRASPQVVLAEKVGQYTPVWPGTPLRDGRSLILSGANAKNHPDILRYDMQTKQFTTVVQTPFEELTPAVSPDERWVAYGSNRSGQSEIYVEPLSGDGAVWQVSANGGQSPQWRADGRELFFISAPDRVMAASVVPGDTFKTAAPIELFRMASASLGGLAAAPDGQRFVAIVSEGRNVREPLTIVTDWRKR